MVATVAHNGPLIRWLKWAKQKKKLKIVYNMLNIILIKAHWWLLVIFFFINFVVFTKISAIYICYGLNASLHPLQETMCWKINLQCKCCWKMRNCGKYLSHESSAIVNTLMLVKKIDKFVSFPFCFENKVFVSLLGMQQHADVVHVCVHVCMSFSLNLAFAASSRLAGQ